MSRINNAKIFEKMEEWAPKSLAYDWDNVGLQVGSYEQESKKVLVTLDVLNNVVDEAIEKEVDLIIAHHPLLFRPLHEIDFRKPKGKIVQKLIKHDISVYASHTNHDIAPGGINDLLSDALGLKNKRPLVPFKREDLFKLAVFVPVDYVEDVRNALSEAGAGFIGNYSHCTFQTEGQGTFMPREGSNPFSGKINELKFADELKIETIVEESILPQVIQAMKDAHPYEEVAHDIYPLKNEGKLYGLGRIGQLDEKLNLKTFSEKVKQAFDCSTIRITGNLNKQIKRVALVGGSGEKYINEANKQGADVYITGDITFHHAQDAMEMGLAVIDAGHYIEKVFKEATKNYLEKSFKSDDLTFYISTENTDPFRFV